MMPTLDPLLIAQGLEGRCNFALARKSAVSGILALRQTLDPVLIVGSKARAK